MPPMPLATTTPGARVDLRGAGVAHASRVATSAELLAAVEPARLGPLEHLRGVDGHLAGDAREGSSAYCSPSRRADARASGEQPSHVVATSPPTGVVAQSGDDDATLAGHGVAPLLARPWSRSCGARWTAPGAPPTAVRGSGEGLDV